MVDLINLEEEIIKALHTSENYDEWTTKFLKMLQTLPPNMQICEMIMDGFITSQFRREYFVLFAAWLCSVNEEYRTIYEHIFKMAYEINSPGEPNLHRIYEETKFFATLLHKDSISWTILSCIKLKETSTSTQEYFITLLLLELSRNFGTEQLCQRLKDATLQKEFEGLFPKDKLENALYAIKIFELVDLKALTIDLHEYVNSFQNKELTFGVQQMSL